MYFHVDKQIGIVSHYDGFSLLTLSFFLFMAISIEKKVMQRKEEIMSTSNETTNNQE